MIVMTLTSLVANAFIELNKKNDVRKIYLKDIVDFNKVLHEEANANGLNYIGNPDSIYFNELRFNYSAFFNLYEDVDGYVISVKNGVSMSDIENKFRNNNDEIILALLVI